MASGPITSWQIDGEAVETVTDFILGGSKITADGDYNHEIKRCLLIGRKVMTNLDSIFGERNGDPLQYSCLENPRDRGDWWAAVYGVAQSRTWLKRLSSSSSSRQHIKRQRHSFADTGPSSQGYGFSSSHVWMWEDYKESWALKNWFSWIVGLDKTLESPLGSKGIQPTHPKGNQSWIFIRRTDTEAETPILWPPDVKNWFVWKDWSWDRLKVGEGDDRGWDGWMASPSWFWVNSGSWWWTGRPGVL